MTAAILVLAFNAAGMLIMSGTNVLMRRKETHI